ncbi:MAG: DUF4384 domain-containing protein [Planctomycetaceae bacterium]|nr:DUF4384 domain-containing protein [Planctomycetaceae bacterium]
MLTTAEKVKIIDLGLIRSLTETPGLMQTQPSDHSWLTGWFASPEQHTDQEVGQQADIYSLGKVFYFLLNFDRSWCEVSPKYDLPDRTSDIWRKLPVKMAEVIQKAAHPQKQHRYQSAKVFLDQLIMLGGDFERPLQCINRMQTLQKLTDRDVQIKVAHDLATVPFPHPPDPPDRPKLRWGRLGLIACLLMLTFFGVWYFQTPPPKPEWEGGIDVRILMKEEARTTEEGGLTGPFRRLHQQGVLPLHPGDHAQIEVQLNQPGYLYVVLLEANGSVAPLYPWENYEWSYRGPEDSRQKLLIPDDPTFQNPAAPLSPGNSGIEGLLLMVRSTPLPQDADSELAAVLAEWPKQTELFDPVVALWLENGEDVFDETDRDSWERSVLGSTIPLTCSVD